MWIRIDIGLNTLFCSLTTGIRRYAPDHAAPSARGRRVKVVFCGNAVCAPRCDHYAWGWQKVCGCFLLPLPSVCVITYIKHMRFARQYITLSFALVFLLSGMVNAYARATMAGAQHVEICAELGYSSVTLGMNGEKLPKLHDCSSCCIAVGVLQEAPLHVARSSAADLAAWRGFELALNPGDAIFSTWPRGPPIRV